jgi:TolB-like protein
LIVGLLWFLSWRRAPSVQPDQIKSLAVLPLENLSGDPAQDYFADGMTETLISGLAKVGALQVSPRTSVMQYQQSRKPLADIAHELNVDAVVEGSVQRFGDQVKITVRLIHAPTGRRLWGETYERDLRDALALQNEIAAAIAQQIQIKLTPQEQTRLASARPVNPAAYDDYLRGMKHGINSRWFTTTSGLSIWRFRNCRKRWRSTRPTASRNSGSVKPS